MDKEAWRRFAGPHDCMEEMDLAWSSRGLIWSRVNYLDAEKLERALLESTEAKFNDSERWLDYVALLEPGDYFCCFFGFKTECRKQHPVELAPEYDRYYKSLAPVLAEANFRLGDPLDSDLMHAIRHSIDDPFPSNHCILAVASKMQGLKYNRRRVERPRQFPMRPLEKAIWEAADHDPVLYYQLAGDYNTACPIWLLEYRKL